MGIFGWDLPPGCTTRHIEEAYGTEGPCDVCGRDIDHCICPECPVCQGIGDPACYEHHGVVRSAFQIASRAEAEAAWAADNAAENRAYEQMWLDDNYWEAHNEGDMANAIGWASRRVP